MSELKQNKEYDKVYFMPRGATGYNEDKVFFVLFGKEEVGEWIDKEPRADGKPRRWRPFETREAREFIKQDKNKV